MGRALPDVATWGGLTVVQMRRVGVDSLPLALFIAAFTGVVLALSTQEFLKGLKLFDRFKDTWFGLFKGATFGCTITLVGCIVGLATRGGAEGVGRSTTRAVVYSAVLLLVLDAFWALVLLR